MRRCFCSNNNQNTLNTANISEINNCNNQNAGVNNIQNALLSLNNNSSNCVNNDSIQKRLCNFLGLKCLCTFVANNNNEIEERTGILQEVGNNYIILKSCSTGNCILCNTEYLLFIRCCNE